MRKFRPIVFFAIFVISALHLEARIITEGSRPLPTLPSTYAPLAEIGNVHLVGEHSNVIRGAMPAGLENLLVKDQVEKVLIFRKQVRDEVDREKGNLAKAGLKTENIFNVPFDWTIKPEFKAACGQIVEALNILRRAEQEKKKIYFHCTVGEDRTGILAALYRVAFDKVAVKEAFAGEMCARGYSAANKVKPDFVIDKIQENLTPLFKNMAVLLSESHAGSGLVPLSLCNKLPTHKAVALSAEGDECPRGLIEPTEKVQDTEESKKATIHQ